ncbi:MAG: DUF1857 family protein [Pseudohongiella sp.]|nr:DUF1857 family protein [Pseudohongiella sp.]
MLEFEHIIQVNDLTDSDISVLSRYQLWEGLILRARRPDKFVRGLSVHTEDLAGDEFERTIEVGDSRFLEQVMVHPDGQIHTKTLEDLEQIYAESLTQIEEPEPGFLFVRFTYKRELEDEDSEVDVGEHLKSAYLHTDMDAIATIRELAESGLFGEFSN